MKKIVCTMLCIMLLFVLSACGGDVSEVKTHNVESESYSEEDIKAAIDTIKKEFKSDWKGIANVMDLFSAPDALYASYTLAASVLGACTLPMY